MSTSALACPHCGAPPTEFTSGAEARLAEAPAPLTLLPNTRPWDQPRLWGTEQGLKAHGRIQSRKRVLGNTPQKAEIDEICRDVVVEAAAVARVVDPAAKQDSPVATESPASIPLMDHQESFRGCDAPSLPLPVFTAPTAAPLSAPPLDTPEPKQSTASSSLTPEPTLIRKVSRRFLVIMGILLGFIVWVNRVSYWSSWWNKYHSGIKPGGVIWPSGSQIKIKGEIQPTRFPLLCNDDVWLQNDSTVPITNVRVLAVVLRNGQQITTNTLTLPTLNGGAGHTWPGVLKIPDGKIEAGSYLKVQCDQLLLERIIWFQK